MATLNFNYSVLSATIRRPDMPPGHPTPYPDPTRTMYLTCSASPPFEGVADLSVDGGRPSWLTIPETCEDQSPFSVIVNGWDATMQPGDYEVTIRATKDTYTDAVCVLTVAVRPLGHPRLSSRRRR